MLKIKTVNSNRILMLVIPAFILAFVYIFKLVVPFDGLEFNGDSYRYYLASIDASHSISEFTLPPPIFWPYGYPLLAGISVKILGQSFESAQFITVLTSVGFFWLVI